MEEPPTKFNLGPRYLMGWVAGGTSTSFAVVGLDRMLANIRPTEVAPTVVRNLRLVDMDSPIA
jgi:hypothetical protein